MGGAFVASGQSSAQRRSRERFLQPMSGGQAPHVRPSQSGGHHESPDDPPSNQQASGGEKKPLPPKEEECGCLDQRSADGDRGDCGTVCGFRRAFCRRSWLERTETVVIVVEQPRSWAVDFGSWVWVPPSWFRSRCGRTKRTGTPARLDRDIPTGSSSFGCVCVCPWTQSVK